MGKSASKIIEELHIGRWPKRYIVTNTEKIILVTYDLRHAERVAAAIRQIENPKEFFIKTK